MRQAPLGERFGKVHFRVHVSEQALRSALHEMLELAPPAWKQALQDRLRTRDMQLALPG